MAPWHGPGGSPEDDRESHTPWLSAATLSKNRDFQVTQPLVVNSLPGISHSGAGKTDPCTDQRQFLPFPG